MTAALTPYVKLTFHSRPAGAVIHDARGDGIGVTPGVIGVPPGETALSFVLRRDGYQDADVTVVPDRARTVRATLTRGKK